MHAKDFLAYTNNYEQLGQDVGLGFPLHDTNGLTLGETVCKSLRIGKESFQSKSCAEKKKKYGAAVDDVVLKGMLWQSEKEDYIYFSSVVVLGCNISLSSFS